MRSASDNPQTLTVEMRGKVIDTRVLSDHDWHSLSYSIPPSTNPPAVVNGWCCGLIRRGRFAATAARSE